DAKRMGSDPPETSGTAQTGIGLLVSAARPAGPSPRPAPRGRRSRSRRVPPDSGSRTIPGTRQRIATLSSARVPSWPPPWGWVARSMTPGLVQVPQGVICEMGPDVHRPRADFRRGPAGLHLAPAKGAIPRWARGASAKASEAQQVEQGRHRTFRLVEG